MKTNQQGFTLIELMIVVAIIAILAAIAIPQYQNYVARSQVSRAVGETGSLKTAVEDCLASNDTACANASITSDLHSSPATAIAVGSGVVINGAGVSSITMSLGGSVSSLLTGKSVKWSRSATGDWTCTSGAGVKLAPKNCP